LKYEKEVPSMALNRLKANICGTTYTLVSEESLSYMRDLVAEVDNDMMQILTADSRMSTTMAAVLTAVTNADKARKESAAADDLRLKLKRLVDDNESIEDRLAAARAEVDRLTKENLALRAAQTAAPKKPARKETQAQTTLMDSFEEILDDAEET